LDGLEVLKNCSLKTKNVLRPFLDPKDLKLLILDEAKLDEQAGNKQVFSVTGIIPA